MVCARRGTPVTIPIAHAFPVFAIAARRLCDDCILLLDHVDLTDGVA